MIGQTISHYRVVEKLGDWPALNFLFAHTLLYPLGSLMIPGALQTVFDPSPVPDGHASRVGASLALRPTSYLHNAQDMNRLSEFLQRQSALYDANIRNLLVIHGTRDEVVPFWNHGQRLQRVVDTLEVALLEGHGHALHHVDPVRVSTLIHDFARRLPDHVPAAGVTAR